MVWFILYLYFRKPFKISGGKYLKKQKKKKKKKKHVNINNEKLHEGGMGWGGYAMRINWILDTILR